MPIDADAEREAMEWLDAAVLSERSQQHRATIKRLLAEPHIPAFLSDDLVEAIWNAAKASWMSSKSHHLIAEDIVVAIRDFRPKRTKTVWRLQPEGWPYEDHDTIAAATSRAGHWLMQDIHIYIEKQEVKVHD